jgi:hypothetical protein
MKPTGSEIEVIFANENYPPLGGQGGFPNREKNFSKKPDG